MNCTVASTQATWPVSTSVDVDVGFHVLRYGEDPCIAEVRVRPIPEESDHILVRAGGHVRLRPQRTDDEAIGYVPQIETSPS